MGLGGLVNPYKKQVWVKSCMGLGGVCHAPKKLGQHYRHQHNGHATQVGPHYGQGGGLPLG